MSAYYNEHDKYAAAWLRNLISAGHIAPGDVDERDIEDVLPDDIKGYTQCHWFAGIATWSLALRNAGWPDDRPVWTGSCPCQSFSQAGKGAGFADERHLWPALFHHIQHGKPSGVPVFGEQVASPNGLVWLDLVQNDMEAEGYSFRAVDLCAAGVGAPHLRQRLFFVADPKRDQQLWKEPCIRKTGRMGWTQQPVPWDRPWKTALAEIRAMDDGVSRNLGATDAIRNAIVPRVAEEFIKAVMAG